MVVSTRDVAVAVGREELAQLGDFVVGRAFGEDGGDLVSGGIGRRLARRLRGGHGGFVMETWEKGMGVWLLCIMRFENDGLGGLCRRTILDASISYRD